MGGAAAGQSTPVKFTSISARDGLSANAVNAILKDHYGWMWFATSDGLNRFDGTNFTVYRHKAGDSGSLRANEILSLYEDRSGNLWVGTSGGALSLYDRKRDAFINFPAAGQSSTLLPSALVRSIAGDQHGKIWIAQYNAPNVLDPANGTIEKFDLAPSSGDGSDNITLYCVFGDSKGRMWVGTDHGLFLYQGDQRGFRQYRYRSSDASSLAEDDVRAMTEDRDGNVWVGTDSGLCRLREDGGGFVRYDGAGGDAVLGRGVINSLAADKDGLLWVGTMQGLHILDPRTGHSTVCQPEEGNLHSIASRAIRCIFIDNQGIYWFGTFRSGVSKYDKNLNLFNAKLGDAFREYGTETTVVTSFEERRDGNLWLGTDGGGLYSFDRKADRLERLPVVINGKPTTRLAVLALKKTADNKLYIGTWESGLIVEDLATGKTRQLLKGDGSGGLSANDIFCFSEDGEGRLWAGTNGSGINILKGGKVVARLVPHPVAAGDVRLPINSFIRAIAEDAEGRMWIGTHGGGIAVYEKEGNRFKVYDQDDGALPSNKIQSMLLDSKGRMWIGTYGGGLVRYDKAKDRFIVYDEKDGLQNTNVYQVVEDKAGLIWVTTNTGVSSLDPATGVFRNFTPSNGLQNNNFVHQSGMRTSEGELFFGGQQGFNYFYPAGLTTNRNVPPVVLTDLKVANRSVVPANSAPIAEQISIARDIHLNFRQNFALSYGALDYTLPKENRYAYKLEGFDRDWNYVGSQNTAYYTNLDPGEYVFRVKASNNDGVWSTTDSSIRIYVRPPWWRTVYAYVFYVLLAGCLLLYSRQRGLARVKKRFVLEQEKQEARRVQELDKLKLKFLTNLSHEFRTPISLIMGPADQLLSSQKDGKDIDRLQLIRRNSRRLLNLVNQLLDFRKMEEQELKLQLSEGEFVGFFREICQSFADLSERKSIRLTVETTIDRLFVKFDKDKVERILFNLLSNAFKFTPEGGTISVILGRVEEWIAIKVVDTGIGIPADKKELVFQRFFQNATPGSIVNAGTGIGLSITREFVMLHGGTISVESEVGKGSIFTVRLPLAPASGEMRPEVGDEMRTAVVEGEVRPVGGEGSQAVASRAVSEGSQAVASRAVSEGSQAVASHAVSEGGGPEAPGKKDGAPVGKATVLLVEDNEDFRFYLKDNLKAFYTVVEAANGNEGWKKALASHPSLIVSDVSMPYMDGITLTRQLKADKRTAHIPVILLTALTEQGQQLAGLATGANDYITKPFDFELLLAKIRNLLDLSRTLKTTYTKQISVSPASSGEPRAESADEKLMREAVACIEANLDNPDLSVEFLSRQLVMSRTTLYNKMLELTGETPVEYIRSIKLEKASALLQRKELTISEIAYKVGFSSPNYFARAFKAKYKMLPSEYAQQYRKQGQNDNNQYL